MTTLRWGTPQPAFPRKDGQVFKVWEITEDPSELFMWTLVTVDGKRLAWLQLSEEGRWLWWAADANGNPDGPTFREINLGDLDRQADFRKAREALAMESSEAVKAALVTAHRTKLALYKDETFDLAAGIAKRRAERLEW